MTKTIIIAGVECEVLRYNEEVCDDSITIDCVHKTTEEQLKQIRDSIGTSTYFKVIRPDINETPLIMRYGGYTIWSKHDNYIKRKICLVENNYDNSIQKYGLPFFCDARLLDKVISLLGKNVAYINFLEKHLLENNIISEKDLIDFKINCNDLSMKIERELFCVDDVEKFR